MTAVPGLLRLVLVTDERVMGDRDWVTVCRAAVRGGVTAVQVRHKSAGGRRLAELVRRLGGELSCPLFVNDRLDVALATGADGVHLGPDDVPAAIGVALRPEGFLVGASVGTDGEMSEGAAADYWGVGPFRDTATKRDAGAALGADGLGRIVQRAAGRPCVAIGGIRVQDVADAVAAGAAGVAVVSGVLGARDVEAAARRYADALEAAGLTGAAD